MRGGELVPDHHGDARAHAAGQADHAAHRVVEGQRAVEDVTLLHSDDGGQTSGGQNVASMLDNSSFGHARGPAGVDVHQLIFEVDRVLDCLW